MVLMQDRDREQSTLPLLEQTLSAQSIDNLKWYLGALGQRTTLRKAELVEALRKVLLDPQQARVLIARMRDDERMALAEVVHRYGGYYLATRIKAKYPSVSAPFSHRRSYYSKYGDGTSKVATEFELFLYEDYHLGTYVPTDLAAIVRAIVPTPPPTKLASSETPPALVARRKSANPPEMWVSHGEASVMHDLAATLILVGEGKVSVGASTNLPTLPAVRALRPNLIGADYFPDDYNRAEDAMRPQALVMLAQAARWATPVGNTTKKLQLTAAGQDLMARGIGPKQVREAWERWLKNNLLDELSRIRSIKGQQSAHVRLIKPSQRRAQVADGLRRCPIGRWVLFDDFLRYLLVENMLPGVERDNSSGLRIGNGSDYYGPGFDTDAYWDLIQGQYLRAFIFEYAATLGIVEVAYVRAEQTPHKFATTYYWDEDTLSRYDGLVGLKLTRLGAYALGLEQSYTPPEQDAETADQEAAPLLHVLPNLDIVVMDVHRMMPNERIYLERIADAESRHVYRLSREKVLDAAHHGFDPLQVRAFLASRAGVAENGLPNTVLHFFDDAVRRLHQLRDAGKMLIIESDDPYLLADLSTSPGLRTFAERGSIGKREVLLIPEEHEAEARRILKKMGYAPHKLRASRAKK